MAIAEGPIPVLYGLNGATFAIDHHYVATALLLGATLSRAIVGASPAVPTLMASLALVLIHRALAWTCVRSRWLESLMVGVEREVYKDGQFNSQQMSAALITRTDVFETARQELHSLDLQDVQSAIIERNGQVSLIRKAATGN